MRANLEKYIRAKRPIIWCNTNDYKEVDDLLKESIKNIENKEIYEFRALGVVDLICTLSSTQFNYQHFFL